MKIREKRQKGMRHRAELGVLGNDDEVVETTSAKKYKKTGKNLVEE